MPAAGCWAVDVAGEGAAWVAEDGVVGYLRAAAPPAARDALEPADPMFNGNG